MLNALLGKEEYASTKSIDDEMKASRKDRCIM